MNVVAEFNEHKEQPYDAKHLSQAFYFDWEMFCSRVRVYAQ